MKKIRLGSIGNSDNFSYYLFEKNQTVYEFLSRALGEVLKLDLPLFDENYGKKGKYTRKKIIVNRLKDKHDRIGISTRLRADIFFGDKKLFLIIHCSESLRLKFNEYLGRFTYMPNPKKTKIGKLT
jgi:hypothetical protein